MLNKWASIALLGVIILSSFEGEKGTTLINPPYPSFWPEPVYNFSEHQITSDQVQLGRKLFYDPILSADSTISCASCHLSYTSFTHVDHALSHGIGDSIGRRNSPVIMNVAWQEDFMWDGAINNIEVQPLAPISNPLEMGSNMNDVVEKLGRHSKYRKLFYQAYGDSTITGEHVLKAIAQFQLTLVSSDSKYDSVNLGLAQFSEQEQKGYDLFKANCVSCHTEPFFTNANFENNGIAIDPEINDLGRYEITQQSEDSLRFKVPTLRNIQYSRPYMHDGRYKTLKECLDYYADHGDCNDKVDDRIREIEITGNDKADIIAFLYTLSDRKFMFNENYSFPK